MAELNKQKAPKAVAALVLGICSIVVCWLPLVGLILAIVGMALAKKGKAIVNENPDLYTGAGMLKGGKICAIIGLILSILYHVYYVLMAVFFSGVAFGAFDIMDELF